MRIYINFSTVYNDTLVAKGLIPHCQVTLKIYSDKYKIDKLPH